MNQPIETKHIKNLISGSIRLFDSDELETQQYSIQQQSVVDHHGQHESQQTDKNIKDYEAEHKRVRLQLHSVGHQNQLSFGNINESKNIEMYAKSLLDKYKSTISGKYSNYSYRSKSTDGMHKKKPTYDMQDNEFLSPPKNNSMMQETTRNAAASVSS